MSDSSQTWCMVPTDPASDCATQVPNAIDESNAETMTALTNVANEGKKDETYYWDTVKFLVEGTCFKVPRYQFVIGSTYFAGKLEPTKLSDHEGDKAPITLEGATASQFRVLLKLLFPIHTTSTTLKFSKEEWLIILELSTLWDFHESRKLAKEHLEPQLDDPIERIVVGRAAYIPRWVLEGYEALITRSECISEQESERIGHLTTVRLYILRHERSFEPGSIASRFRGEIHALEHKEKHHMSAEEKRIEEEKRLEEEEQRLKEEEEQRVDEEKRRVKAARRAQEMEERWKFTEAECAERAEPERAEPEGWPEPWAEDPAEAKVEEPKVEEPTVEQPKAEDPKVEEPKVEEPKVEEPTVEEPTVEEPTVEEPTVEEPTVEEPTVEEPKVEEPKVEAKVEDPAEAWAEVASAEGVAAEAKGLQKETEREVQEDGQRLQEKEDSKQNQEEEEALKRKAEKEEQIRRRRARKAKAKAKARAEHEETERKEKEEERRREEEERLQKEADERIQKKEEELRMEETRIAQELADLEKQKEEARIGRSSSFGVESDGSFTVPPSGPPQ